MDRPTKDWEVQTLTLCDGWINIWQCDEEPVRFETRAQAQSSLEEFFTEIEKCVAAGYLEDFSRDDYRIAKVEL